MKKGILLIALIFLLSPGTVLSADGTNSCGYEMVIIPAPATIPTPNAAVDQPAILDAWTTNNPFGNPSSEEYSFTGGQDTLAFVVKYHHIGGPIPEQWNRGWRCGNETQPVKTCNFKWTAVLPIGDYLLINYFSPVDFRAGEYDWAAKVGNVVFGWPNIDATRPWCFIVQ